MYGISLVKISSLQLDWGLKIAESGMIRLQENYDFCSWGHKRSFQVVVGSKVSSIVYIQICYSSISKLYYEAKSYQLYTIRHAIHLFTSCTRKQGLFNCIHQDLLFIYFQVVPGSKALSTTYIYVCYSSISKLYQGAKFYQLHTFRSAIHLFYILYSKAAHWKNLLMW